MRPASKNAPGAAGTATEGKESTSQQKEESVTQNTAPASYLVLLVAAGLQQIVAHATDFSGAIALITSDATRRFGWESIEHTITTGDYVRMTTTVGLEVEYRLIPHDRPVPEDELSAEEIDAIDDEGVQSVCALCAAGIVVEQIPTLIDALTELHRAWLHAGGAA